MAFDPSYYSNPRSLINNLRELSQSNLDIIVDKFKGTSTYAYMAADLIRAAKNGMSKHSFPVNEKFFQKDPTVHSANEDWFFELSNTDKKRIMLLSFEYMGFVIYQEGSFTTISWDDEDLLKNGATLLDLPLTLE